MFFRAQRTIVEVDGLLKYRNPDDPDALVNEKLREDRLREAGWEVVRVTWAQLKGNREKLRKRLLAAFARGLRQTA
jgi:very-short-patch-repair endonuclease